MKCKALLFSIFILFTTAFFNCASTTSTQKIAPSSIVGAITLPSGWDDSIIEQIKAGKSTKNILAVLDFEGNEKLKGKVDV